MKTNFKSLALAAIAVLGMSACSNELDEQLIKADGQELSYNLTINGPATRTITEPNSYATKWANNDEVGLYAFAKGADLKTATPLYSNVKLTYNGTTWAASEAIPSGVEYDFYAYYPYMQGVADHKSITFNAMVDQTTAANVAASDPLAAKATTTAADQQVNLSFNHLFSMVEVIVKGDKVTAQPEYVNLDNVITTASLDFAATGGPAATVAQGTASNVKTFLVKFDEAAKQAAYRAVVPAQTVAKENSLLTVVNLNGTSYAMKFTPADPQVAGAIYEAGKYHQLTVTLNEKAAPALSINKSDIIDWAPGQGQSGNGTEVVPPAEPVVPVTVLTDFGLNANTTFTAKGKYASNNTIKQGNGWFTRFADVNAGTKAESVASTFATVVDPQQTHAIRISLDALANNGWNYNSVCYRVDKPFKQGKYKITMLAKPSKTGVKTAGGVMIRTADDTRAMGITTKDGHKTLNSFTITDETTVTATFDFTVKSNQVNAGVVTTTEPTVAEDVNGICIYLLCNTKGGSIDCSLVKLEEVVVK